MWKNLRPWLLIAFFALFFGAAFTGCVIMAREEQECNAKGGVYVKQLMTYRCVYLPREQ